MKLRFLILLTFLFAGLLFSQTENTENPNPQPENYEWSIQFQVLDNFRLSSFEGSTISLKRKLSDCSSIRFGISSSADFFNLETDSNLLPTTVSNSSSQENNQFGFAVSSVYLLNTKIKRGVKVYYGVGPLFSYGYNKNKNESINNENKIASRSVITHNIFGVGVSGIFGVEWFVRDNISFMGEYEANVNYIYSTRNFENSDGNLSYQIKDETKTSSYSLKSVGVKLGISVYF